MTHVEFVGRVAEEFGIPIVGFVALCIGLWLGYQVGYGKAKEEVADAQQHEAR